MPLFPLRLVVFPRDLVPLHIFEERYQRLIGEMRGRGEEGRFGIVLVQEEGTAEIGCAVSLERVVREYGDGRLDILVRGREVIAVREILGDQPYFTARVELLRDLPEAVDEQSLATATALLRRLAEVSRVSAEVAEGAGELSVYQLAAAAGLPASQRQRLLELRSERARLELLVQLLREAITAATAAAEQRRRIGGNGKLRPLSEL
jgi:Lon protease-like protein